MRLNLLDYKRKILKGGKELVDLTTASIRYNNSENYIIDAFYIGSEMKMRPDLISKAAYGNIDDWDLLLKFNGVSNPFSIDEDDLIAIPDLNWMMSQLNDASKDGSEEDIRGQYVDKTKVREVDINKRKYNEYIKTLHQKINIVNENDIYLPPNLSQPGEKEATIINDVVYLGNDISSIKK